MSHDLFTAVTLAADEWLILVARRSLDVQEAERISAQVPAALAGRVVVVSDMDAYVASALPGGDAA